MYKVNCSCGNRFTVNFWYTRSVKPANFVLELYLISDVNDFVDDDFVDNDCCLIIFLVMFLNNDDDVNILYLFVY